MPSVSQYFLFLIIAFGINSGLGFRVVFFALLGLSEMYYI